MNILYLQDHVDFTLDENETLSSLGLKSAQNLNCDHILKIAHIKHNCNDRLIFEISDMESLSTVYKGLNDAMIVSIFASISKVFRLVSEKAFLEREFVLMDMEHIYIDREASKPKFIILPVSTNDGASAKEWYTQVVNTVSALMYGRDALTKGRLAQISNAFEAIRSIPQGDVLELINAKKKVVEAVIATFPNDEEFYGEQPVKTNSACNSLALRYRGAFGEFAFYITKPTFYIGSSPEMDGVMNFNPTVSRKHLVISINNGICCLQDLGSRNGTYINGNRCTAGQQYQLKDKDILRISDMDFAVEM